MENNTTENNDTTKVTSIHTPHKRYREVLQNSLLGNIFKTPRLTDTESPLKFITIMDKRFEKLTEKIQTIIHTKFIEYKTDLLNKLDKRFNAVKNEISEVRERVVQLETVASDVINMQNEIKTLKTQLKRQENSSVACDLLMAYHLKRMKTL